MQLQETFAAGEVVTQVAMIAGVVLAAGDGLVLEALAAVGHPASTAEGRPASPAACRVMASPSSRWNAALQCMILSVVMTGA